MSFGVNNSYPNNGYEFYGFTEGEAIAKTIANSSEEQNSKQSSSISSNNYDDFDETQVKQAMRASLEDQSDEEEATQQAKKHKSTSFLSSCLPASFFPSQSLPISTAGQEVITPGVAFNRGQKRKATEEITRKVEAKPATRTHAIINALPSAFAGGITGIITFYEGDPTKDIILSILQRKLVKNIAYLVTTLDLTKFPTIKDINAIFSNFTGITSLTIPNWANGLYLKTITKFEKLQSGLRELSLLINNYSSAVEINISRSDLAILTDFENLQKLQLRYSAIVVDDDLISLGRFKTIESLELSSRGNYVTDAGLASLVQLENLKKLVLSLGDECNITDAGFANLTDLKKLKSLYLEFSRSITNGTLATISQSESLQELGLKRCNNITDAGLAGFKKLQSLTLDGCDTITEAGIAQLDNLRELNVVNRNGAVYEFGRFTGLQKLKITFDNSVTDANLLGVSDLINLQELVLEQTNDNNIATDVGFSSLAKLTNLQKLKIKGFVNITDESLVALAKIDNLKEIDLSGCTMITDDGIARAKEINNSLQINRS